MFSSQSILKEINPEYSLEGLMLKLKLQYFGHLMLRTNSLGKTLMLGKTDPFLYFLLIIFLFIIIMNKTFWGLFCKLNVTSFFYMNIFLKQFIPRVCHMSI